MPEFGTMFPFRYGATQGHYRATWRAAIVNAQAAGSRLFTIRNTDSSDMLVVTSLILKVLQTGAFTAALEDSFDVTRLTGFTADDNANNAAAVGSTMYSAISRAFPGSASVQGVTAAGAAAGMTGGVMTPDAGPIGQLPAWFLAAEPTTAQVFDTRLDDMVANQENGHPLVIRPTEGLAITNRVLLGAAAAADFFVDISWSQVTKP